MEAKWIFPYALAIIVVFERTHAKGPRTIKNTSFKGGLLVKEQVSLHYCMEFCDRLGGCWGVDFQREPKACFIHQFPQPCNEEDRQDEVGIDHVRLKGCWEQKDDNEIEDEEITELKAQFDAKSGRYADCLIHIYERSHAIGGTPTSTGVNLRICVDMCIEHTQCKAVDFERDGGRCYFYIQDVPATKLEYATCCHHVGITCSISHNYEYQHGYLSGGSSGGQGYPTKTTSTTSTTASTTTSTTASTRKTASTGYIHQHYHGHYYHPTTTMPPAPSTSVEPTIPPIPDEFCPFVRMPATSRMGGDIVPKAYSKQRMNEEMCKRTCFMMNSDDPKDQINCFGADWDIINRACFLFYTSATLESSRDQFNLSNPYVTHYLYQPCYSIKNYRYCIKHGPLDLPPDTAIAGQGSPNYDLTECTTYCFYKFSVNMDTTPMNQLERGCGSGRYMEWRQCAGPPPTERTISTECHCVGDLCNTLSYDGHYHLLAYYPFDCNTLDLSGYQHHARSYGSIKCVVFDKRSANASLFFDGRSHIEIPSLKLIHRSDVQLEGDLRLSTALSFWMKRTGLVGEMTIMSNTNKREFSSIEFYSKIDPNDSGKHVIVAGVNINNTFHKVESDPLDIGSWQFVALNLAATTLSELQLYIEKNPAGAPFPPSPSKTVDFNTTAMNVDLRSKPVTIGKQLQMAPTDKPYFFEGFIDELRFFQGELEPEDIGALVRKTHYELSFP